MEDSMKSWSDKEIKDLFNQVENFKNQNMTMKEAFEAYAKIYQRKPNSVRNYYYFELENLKKDPKKCNFLNIDLKNHEKNDFVLFNKDQESQLIQQVDALLAQGKSVRSACLTLAKGDLTLMTRLQNKYQNIKRKDKKIIAFKKKQISLTEQDINSLFLGLVKLIKKTAVEDYLSKNRQTYSNTTLKRVYLDLNNKALQLAQLREELEKVKAENMALKSVKQQAFKDHLNKNNQNKFEKENV